MDNLRRSMLNTYTAQPLDRASHGRQDADWLSAQYQHPEASYLVLNNHDVVTVDEQALTLNQTQFKLLERTEPTSLLGIELAGENQGNPVFVFNVADVETDLANLKTIKLYRDRYSLAEIEAYIETAIEKKAWLIFYTHDVAENPSPYGCAPAYFEAVVKACANKKIKVLTIDKTLDQIESATQKRKYNSLQYTLRNN